MMKLVVVLATVSLSLFESQATAGVCKITKVTVTEPVKGKFLIVVDGTCEVDVGEKFLSITGKAVDPTFTDYGVNFTVLPNPTPGGGPSTFQYNFVTTTIGTWEAHASMYFFDGTTNRYANAAQGFDVK